MGPKVAWFMTGFEPEMRRTFFWKFSSEMDSFKMMPHWHHHLISYKILVAEFIFILMIYNPFFVQKLWLKVCLLIAHKHKQQLFWGRGSRAIGESYDAWGNLTQQCTHGSPMLHKPRQCNEQSSRTKTQALYYMLHKAALWFLFPLPAAHHRASLGVIGRIAHIGMCWALWNEPKHCTAWQSMVSNNQSAKVHTVDTSKSQNYKILTWRSPQMLIVNIVIIAVTSMTR